MLKKIIAFTLALIFTIGFLPIPAHAEDTPEIPVMKKEIINDSKYWDTSKYAASWLEYWMDKILNFDNVNSSTTPITGVYGFKELFTPTKILGDSTYYIGPLPLTIDYDDNSGFSTDFSHVNWSLNVKQGTNVFITNTLGYYGLDTQDSGYNFIEGGSGTKGANKFQKIMQNQIQGAAGVYRNKGEDGKEGKQIIQSVAKGGTLTHDQSRENEQYCYGSLGVYKINGTKGNLNIECYPIYALNDLGGGKIGNALYCLSDVTSTGDLASYAVNALDVVLAASSIGAWFHNEASWEQSIPNRPTQETLAKMLDVNEYGRIIYEILCVSADKGVGDCTNGLGAAFLPIAGLFVPTPQSKPDCKNQIIYNNFSVSLKYTIVMPGEGYQCYQDAASASISELDNIKNILSDHISSELHIVHEALDNDASEYKRLISNLFYSINQKCGQASLGGSNPHETGGGGMFASELPVWYMEFMSVMKAFADQGGIGDVVLQTEVPVPNTDYPAPLTQNASVLMYLFVAELGAEWSFYNDVLTQSENGDFNKYVDQAIDIDSSVLKLKNSLKPNTSDKTIEATGTAGTVGMDILEGFSEVLRSSAVQAMQENNVSNFNTYLRNKVMTYLLITQPPNPIDTSEAKIEQFDSTKTAASFIAIFKEYVGLATVKKNLYNRTVSFVNYYCPSAMGEYLTYDTKYDDTLLEDFTTTVDFIVESYTNQYKAKRLEQPISGMPGIASLRLRVDFFTTMCRYNVKFDAIKSTQVYTDMLNDTTFNVNSVYPDKKNIPICYTDVGMWDTKDMQDLYIFGQLLMAEAAGYCKTIYLNMAVDLIANGMRFTLDGLQDYLDAIVTLNWMYNYMEGCTMLGSEFTSTVIGAGAGADGSNVEIHDEEQGIHVSSLIDLYYALLDLGYISGFDYLPDTVDTSKPYTNFFVIANGQTQFSKNYFIGRAASATYIPMQTNVYDPYSIIPYADIDWIKGFHSKFGFVRKALKIDTNPDAATDFYVSSTSGTTRVATLQDLLNCDKDIVLYIDDNFYNLKPLADLQGKAFDRLTSADEEHNIIKDIGDWMSNFWEVRFDVALKNAEYNEYSIRIKNAISDMGYNGEGETKQYDQYMLSPAKIRQYLLGTETAKYSQFSEMTSFAFVSNIYRDDELFNVMQENTARVIPVFASSPTLGYMPGTSEMAKNTLYNYALLKNIKAMSSVGADITADMTSPVYCDIYGNILTESGIVVVPAASNATLHASDRDWIPINVGFLSTYGKAWSIPGDAQVDKEWASRFFTYDEKNDCYAIKNRKINNTDVLFATLSYADTDVNKAIQEWYAYNLNYGSQINVDSSLRVLHETLRGANMDSIDFDAENLNLNRTLDKGGLVAAAKLDSIINSMNWEDGNSVVSLPNLSFIDNYQYVVVFVFKILLVILIVAIMITIYVDAMKGHFGLQTFLKCLGTLVTAVTAVLVIPISYNLAYYESNKALLQDEAQYIMMLNTEKNLAGREVGVYEVTEPSNKTKVLVKLEDYKFDWADKLGDVIFSDTIKVLDDAYQDYVNRSVTAHLPNAQLMNDGIYIDVQDLFNTSAIYFSKDSQIMYQRINEDPIASYFTPYYYFLDAILLNVNNYNSNNNIYAYSTKIMRGGNVKTVNLVNSYFNSVDFLEDDTADLLGLYQIYGQYDDVYHIGVFNEYFDQASVVDSLWFTGNYMPDDQIAKRLSIMTTKAKEFVANNRDLIGRVTDETFVKCMALSLAIDYNNLFGIPSASAFEIYELSNTDLMRLVVCDRATTLEDSPMSFARFVYNEAGTPGVYASVFLVIITMFVQTAKTVITIAIMALLIISVFVFKILLQQSNHALGGYFLTLAVICGTNVLYALVLQVSLAIPQTGLAPTLCIILQILVQLAYLLLLCTVLVFALRDWKNAGFTAYQNIGGRIGDALQRTFGRFGKYGNRGMTAQERRDARAQGINGWKYFDRLTKQQEKRVKKAGRH